tara:strand:+ start:13931 stop:15004 length:1074 start_codon:yes stop_codon:yes gene_type:complete
MSDDSVENDAEQEAFPDVEQDAQVDDSLNNSDVADPSPPAAQGDGDNGTEAVDAAPAWSSALQDAGFQSFDDPGNAVQALVEANKQREAQVQQYADQVKFYQEQSKFREQYAEPQQTTPEPKKLDPLGELIDGWKEPGWAQQYIETDEEGNRMIADHVDDTTREKILGIDRKMRQWQDVLQDPRQFAHAIDQRVEQMISDKFEQSYTQKQSQATEQSHVDGFINENATWLYQQDPATGNYVQDPISGDFVYSQQGQQFLQHMDSAAKDGVAAASKQIQYAKLAMGVASPTQAVQQQPTQRTAAVAQQQKRAMRGTTNQRTGTQNAFNGVSAESGGSQTGQEQMSFGESVLAAMQVGE